MPCIRPCCWCLLSTIHPFDFRNSQITPARRNTRTDQLRRTDVASENTDMTKYCGGASDATASSSPIVQLFMTSHYENNHIRYLTDRPTDRPADGFDLLKRCIVASKNSRESNRCYPIFAESTSFEIRKLKQLSFSFFHLWWSEWLESACAFR